MLYFVRTTGERALDKSFSQIDYELLIDKEHQPIKSFINQLEYLGTLNDDVVLLEDDIILCKDFKNQIEKAIQQYPNKVINFFCKYNEYFEIRESDVFSNNQCTYYPKEIAIKIANMMRMFPFYSQSYSEIENWALKQLNITHIQYRPCLVQHLEIDKSLIQKHKIITPRRTPYFIDYLEELNINYKDAYLHIKELENLMKTKFKEKELLNNE